MNDNLANMGSAQVRRIEVAGESFIEKINASPIEYHFYHNAAETLRAAGVDIPNLITSNETNHYLLLEFIPLPVAQEEIAHDDVLKVLANLHCQCRHSHYAFRRHTWSEQANEQAIELLQLSGAGAVQLITLQKRSDEIFSSEALISGDSNAGNWGRRTNGGLVLFDWERFGLGSPAIDLAPLIKGMGHWAEYESIARRYKNFCPRVRIEKLTREIALSKAWIATEVINILFSTAKPELNLYLNWYRNFLPAWLKEIARKI